MGKAFNLGTIFGIKFRLHYTWFIIFILVTVLLVSPDYSQWVYWVMAIIASLLFFASVVAHELAHSLVGRANGVPVTSITLFIFGGVAQMTKEPARPGAELRMAIAGPLCSLALGGLFYLFWFLVPNEVSLVAAVAQWLSVVNVALAVFNMIPGFPLDGGRVLRSLLWHFSGNYEHSTRIATQMGRGVGLLFIVGGVLIVFLRPFGLDWFNGIWFVFIGWFLGSAASASYRQVQWREALRKFTVSQAMVSDCPVVPPDVTVARLIQEYILTSESRSFLVADEDRLMGTLTLDNIKAVPRSDWDTTQVRGIMTPVDRLRVAHSGQDALSILEQMDESGISQMPVVDEGRVIGLIARDNLATFLRTRSESGV